MSIRLKLFLSACAFLSLTVAAALFGWQQEHILNTLAIHIYENVIKGVDETHNAQTEFVRFAAARRINPVIDQEGKAQLSHILAHLDAAMQTAVSAQTRGDAQRIHTQIVALRDMSQAAIPSAPMGTVMAYGMGGDLGAIDAALGRLARRFADDSLSFRLHANRLAAQNGHLLLYGIGMAGGFILLITLLLEQSIVPPLRRAIAIVTAMSEGRLDNDIRGKGHGETGQLQQTLALLQTSIGENIRRIESQMRKAEQQAHAAHERHAALASLAKSFDKQAAKLLQTVAQSASEMKNSAESLAGNAAKTDHNLQQTVLTTTEASSKVSALATAAEELSASINEIATQVARSATITQAAVQKAQAADGTIQHLSDSAQKINEIISVIGSIAAQINLLALNATIESARAGEAGKGFAVVAGEVKTLAGQTSKATEAIAEQVKDIRKVAQEVVDALTAIRKTIIEMGGISTAIASAVEQQGAATQEIARNIHITSSKVQDVAGSVGEVGQMSKTTHENSHQVLESIKAFSSQSETLGSQVERFLKSFASA